MGILSAPLYWRSLGNSFQLANADRHKFGFLCVKSQPCAHARFCKPLIGTILFLHLGQITAVLTANSWNVHSVVDIIDPAEIVSQQLGGQRERLIRLCMNSPDTMLLWGNCNKLAR